MAGRQAGSERGAVDQLLLRLEARIDDIVDRILSAFLERIPAYSTLPEPTVDVDIRMIVRDNVAEWFRVAREQRAPSSHELTEFTDSARRRVHQGIPLEALLHAYRLGATVAWEIILEESEGDSATDMHAALEVAGWLMRYLDHVSTAVAQGYLEEREHLVVDEERRHLGIAGFLLDQGRLSPEAETRFAEAGLKLASEYWVALITLDGQLHDLRNVAQQLREWDPALPVIAVTWGPGVLSLWPAEGEGDIPDGLRRVGERLTRERDEVLISLAGPTDGPLRDLAEEVQALSRAAEGRSGILRLEDMPLGVLIQRADERSVAAIRARLSPLIRSDRERGTDLIETLRAFIDCDGSLRGAGRALCVHRNTVAYRLDQVLGLTGLDPRDLPDLFILYVGLELGDTSLLTSHGDPATPRDSL